MGVYLILYASSLILSFIFYHIYKKTQKKRYEDVATFLIILMLFFLAFALATKDPVEKLLTTIPAFWQFMLTALGGAFAIWRMYLNPLKERVIGVEKNLASLTSEVHTGFNSMKEDITLIKNWMLGKKK